jgi:hypothetical protein
MPYCVHTESVAANVRYILESLSQGRGTIRERLAEVKEQIGQIRLDDMPTARTGASWRGIHDAHANFDLLSEDDAVELVSDLWGLFLDLDTYAEGGE